jgi:hypothetical protein
MRFRGDLVDPGAVRRVALMTVEGEKDDITGVGQCSAVHALCANLSQGMKRHHLEPGVGHYGIFNGSRFRANIVPAISAFVHRHDVRGDNVVRRFLKQIRGADRIAVAPQPIFDGKASEWAELRHGARRQTERYRGSNLQIDGKSSRSSPLLPSQGSHSTYSRYLAASSKFDQLESERKR